MTAGSEMLSEDTIKNNGKKFSIGKAIIFAVVLVCIGILTCAAGAIKEKPGNIQDDGIGLINTEQAGGSKVYFTTEISAKSLVEIYRALGVPVSGKAAIKLHMGEPGNQNYLRPELLKDLVNEVNGSFVDANTAYGGRRGTTAGHLQAAKDHGFTYAPVDILDSEGEIKIPIKNGKHLQEALMGSHILDYDWIISVAHFKGHGTAGYGGTFKNLAIGIATPEGKRQIHTNPGGRMFSSTGEPFFEKVIEYNVALMEARKGKMLYINILNNISVDCDCIANASASTIPDIGIMASLDPVALDKASLDQIYLRPLNERKSLTDRIERQNGSYQVIYAEKMGLGSQAYELVRF
ncbi:MAG: DUF362 domain-containing protein [Treponema sp.]|nr:DUF362 domain-containing protein [Treponema sp.]